MTNSRQEVQTRGWVFSLLVVAILVAFGSGIWWLLSHTEKLELSRFDWTSAEAVATVVAAGVAAASGFSAVYAARVALSVDSRAAQRARDRESRDAFPIARVMQHEMFSLRQKIEKFLTRWEKNQDGLLEYANLRAEMELPTLVQFLGSLGFFDEHTNAALANAISSLAVGRTSLNLEFAMLPSEFAEQRARAEQALRGITSILWTSEHLLAKYAKQTTAEAS